MRLTDEKLTELAEYIEGTASSIEAGLESIGLIAADYDATDVEAQLLEEDCERCELCGWWYESCELAKDDDQLGYCDDCRDSSDDE